MMSKKVMWKGLITKKCVAMHTNCFYNFKTALYFSAVVIKGFNSSRKLFQADIVTVKLKAGLLNV